MRLVAAVDQGTGCVLVNHRGEIASVDQKEHEQIYSRADWVEHDPVVSKNTNELKTLGRLGPVANTDTKLLIDGLFQKSRVLAQDGDKEPPRPRKSKKVK